MTLYFERNDIKGRQGNLCSIASVLSDVYKKTFNQGIKTKCESLCDYEAGAKEPTVAQDRIHMKSVVEKRVRVLSTRMRVRV